MINRIKKFIVEHDTEIAVTACVIASFYVGAWVVKSAILRGEYNLMLSQAAVNDLLAGKDVLVNCLEDAHLLIKYIPKA